MGGLSWWNHERGGLIVRVCSRCIYDENTPGISFDEEGVCNYCRSHEQLDREYPTGAEGEKRLRALADEIRENGKKKKFDCIIGVSGGCDSSYLLYIAKEKLGLRPLAVHFDNTWNTRIAVENLQRVLKKLDIELWTYVMDNREFSDMASSFLKASVPEIDALTDVALTTTLYMAAEKFGVKYIFNGHSFRTEGITPLGWFYFDGKYIDSVHDRFGSGEMERFPNLWLSTWMRWLFMRIKRLRPLYYVDYRKEDVKKFLNSEFGWQWYGGHHMENRYTLFCDNYILPRKFGIDLRYVEYSALIRSGQMTKEEALEEIRKPPPFDDGILVEVKKRLGLTDEEFTRIMSLPKRTYRDFETYRGTFKRMRPFFWIMYKADLVPKSFYIKYTK
jgi:N-acetyl sugar amidotransferase